MNQNVDPPIAREVQVLPNSGKKPRVVDRLANWEYLERSLHRVLAGWGRNFDDWEDKVSVCQHIWETAECVRRIRERLVQFPGTKANLDLPVSQKLEALANSVLLAPSREDAVDGIYQLLCGAIARAYIYYLEVAHPVHDAPTLSMIAENVRTKEQLRLWLQDRRRRIPHVANAEYVQRIREALDACNDLRDPVAVEEIAQPAGVRTDFRPIAVSPVPAGTSGKPDIMPYLSAEFQTNLETRRLFWCYGYMREIHLAEEQMIWIYDAWHMPWDFLQDLSRHTWDESRHGDSGRSRLLDFGIELTDIGCSPYVSASLEEQELATSSLSPSRTRSPQDLYDAVLYIGMVAETGHFTVKHEAYADLKDGGDMESAEMVLFDIIDETTHVQYAHRWLPFMAERLGIPAEHFREVGAEKRAEALQKSEQSLSELSRLPHEGPAYDACQRFLAQMRRIKPLSNAETCPPRTMKPM